MSSKGMLPLPLAYEIKREIYDFLNVSFELKGTKSGEALKKYYSETKPLVKGPFLKVSLPYEATASIDDSPLDLKMKFPPYKHQLNAFERLQHNQSKNTIVTTGTGSGKTECFLYPVLDYVKKLKDSGEGNGGIKAIILYPMNALLDDQAIRFAKTIKEHDLTNLDIRVGRYTGHNGKNRKMDYKEGQVIDHRDELAANPPDILLTNYKMLDYMLFREQEKAFWNENTSEVLKYLILDEMHTFDGAQGSDVACLIRRLKAVAKVDNLTCVGTSATLSSSENAKKELCQFASDLFGSEFQEEAIVEEIKHTVDSYFENPNKKLDSIITSLTGSSIDYEYGDEIEQYLSKVLKAFNLDDYLARPTELAAQLEKFHFLHDLVSICSQTILSVDVIVNKLKEGSYSNVDSSVIKDLVSAFVTMASYARHRTIPNFPFLTIKTSLWSSELKHTLSKVVTRDDNWEFADENDVVNSQDLYLPSVYCAHCGESGWATYYTENEDITIKSIYTKPHTIRFRYAQNKGAILFPLTERTEDNDVVHYLFRKQKVLKSKLENGDEDSEDKPVEVIKANVDEGRCPACDTKLDVRFFSLGASSLTSVIATSCFSHPLNQDRKLISFSDSVQDASHQASFLNNRSFSFSFKKFIANSLEAGQSLVYAQESILKIEAIKDLPIPEQLDLIGRLAPDKLRKKWQLNGYENGKRPPERMLQSLCEVVNYNTFAEFTINSRFGWSFEKVGHSGFFLDEKTFNELKTAPRVSFLEKDIVYNVFENDELFIEFLHGFLQRLKVNGVVYHPYLESYYKSERVDYYPASRRYPDLPLGEYKVSKPKFFAPRGYDNLRRQNYETLGANTGWYWRWFKKFASTNRVVNFYDDLALWLEEQGILKCVSADGVEKKRYCLLPEKLTYQKDLHHFTCMSCRTRYTAPDHLAKELSNTNCTQRFCHGKIKEEETQYSSPYFKRYFSQKPVRINASEHTGSFDPTLKEQVEKEFKRSETLSPNFDVNYLSCTPTMEMGIDIGDLSSVVLKSVPRNAASYFQRIGRSGRTTGNSLDFLVIDRKPHNLYFWEVPSELLNWEVVTPACRYQTGHILKRQYNAFIMDQYLHSETEGNKVLPKSFKWLEELDNVDKHYWEGLFQFEKDHRDSLLAQFQELFNLVGSPVEAELKSYVTSNGVEDNFQAVFKVISEQLDQLDQDILKFKHEIAKINPRDENFFSNVERCYQNEEGYDLDEVLQHFDDTTKGVIQDLYGSISSARNKRASLLNARTTPLLSKLADCGVLPGYAFPEEGCELDFSIRKPVSMKIKDPFHNISIVRSPENALRDLAPYNHFYTHGHEAIINRIGIFGKENPFQNLGTCYSCGHVTNSFNCEVCGNDVERSSSYRYKKVKASTSFQKSYVTDSKESRDVERYEITRQFLFDAPIEDDSRKVISFYNKESQFGYEFQTNVKIYTFNNGFQDLSDTRPFSVCKTCGAVEDPKESEAKKKEKKEKGRPILHHYSSCSAQTEPLKKIKLFREISSDAVRIPVLNTHLIPIMKTVLKRGIELYLKGDTGHLKISDYSQNSYEANTYITIFDNVPGGTGHLRDLFGLSLTESNDSSPRRFLSMLKTVKVHIENCPCDDGCYHCIWSSENIREKEKVTKKGTLFHLERLIAQTGSDFQPLEKGLMEISKENSFDGQTEVMLFHALNAIGPKIPFDDYRFTIEKESVESLWRIQFQDSYCYLKSTPFEQVSLKSEGYTKPDFHVLDKDKKTVGYIFTDGSRYHLNPGQESCVFEQDIVLRQALMKEKKCPVLSFTYRELDELGALISNEDETIRVRDLYEFNAENINEWVSNGANPFIGREGRAILALSSLMRLFKIAAGSANELADSELIHLNGWMMEIMRQGDQNLYVDTETKALMINTNDQLRSHVSSYGYTAVTEEYYKLWVTFWQIFNMASLAELSRSKFKFKSFK